MIRYLVIATIVVVSFLVFLTSWHLYRAAVARRASAVPTSSLPHESLRGGTSTPDASFVGTAPWALSALPECFEQIGSGARGTEAFVASQLPRDAVRIAAPVRLTYGDCTIVVDSSSLTVLRGVDRLRVSPPAELYRRGQELIVLHLATIGSQLRVYRPSKL